MKYAKIKKCDVANGPGVRVSLFVSGCNHHCKGCFNSEAWDFNYGNDFTKKEEDEIIEALKPDYIKGISLLGGEPLEPVNQKGLLPLIKKIKSVYPEKTVWCYTGFLFDKQVLDGMVNKYEETPELLENIDYIVDGKFQEELKNPGLKFRGSSNQRIINVKESMAKKKIVLYNDLEENN